MALIQTQFFSEVLNVASSVNVIMPEPNVGIGVEAVKSGSAPKVLYLLHGYSDDHTIWQRRTSVERYAAAYNLAIIMPAVNHSFYTNEMYGERYWDYVAEELPATMKRFFNISDQPEDTYVAGLSMGGYGSLKLALTYPERFAAAASFSGAVDIADLSHKNDNGIANMQRIFGDLEKLSGSEHDLFALLEKNSCAKKKPRLYISCGEDDFLFDQHKRFVPAAEKAGWNVTHYEEPGISHVWEFWDAQVRFFIPWMMNHEDVAKVR